MTRIHANLESLTWAHERAGLEALALAAWQCICRCGNTQGGTR